MSGESWEAKYLALKAKYDDTIATQREIEAELETVRKPASLSLLRSSSYLSSPSLAICPLSSFLVLPGAGL
jgi:hypothetical protein